jgi:hypothetical protein
MFSYSVRVFSVTLFVPFLILVSACNDPASNQSGPASYSVTVSGTNVIVSPNSVQTVVAGSAQTFTATSSTGYGLSSTVGGSCPAGSWSGNIYTTGAITANCSVSFSANLLPTLSYSGSSGITGTRGSAMSVSPTTLNNNGATITGCALASGSLPAGLGVNRSTCVISGIPSDIGNFSPSIVATSSAGNSAVATISLTVNDIPPSNLTYSTNQAVYSKGVAISSNSPSSSGGTIVSYAVSPALPSGLSLNTSTGIISGKPTAGARGTYTITAANTGGSTTLALNITVVSIYVSPKGSDTTGDGSLGNPFQTLQQAANIANPGDVINAMSGAYSVFTLSNKQTSGLPIVFLGGGKANINLPNGTIPPLGTDPAIDISASNVVFDGFLVNGELGPNQYGIVINGDNVTVSNNQFITTFSGSHDTAQILLYGANSYIVNNVLSSGDSSSLGGLWWFGVVNILAYAPTTVENNDLLGAMGIEAPDGSLIYNNIILTDMAMSVTTQHSEINNNIYLGTSIFYTVGATNQVLGLGAWQTASGEDSNSFTVSSSSSLFQSGGFQLLPNSPAIGKGDRTHSPSTDITGKPRHNPPDVGAYEH